MSSSSVTKAALAAQPGEYKSPGTVLLGMCIGVSLYWLFGNSMSALLPSIGKSLDVQAADPNLVLASSLAGLVAGIFTVPAGGIADRIGRVLMTRLGLAVGLVGMLAAGLAPSVPVLIVARFFQGFASAILMPATLGLVRVYYNDADRPRAISLWSMSTFGATSVSALFGGLVATYIGWRWVFLLAVPFIFLAYYLLRAAPERKAAGTGQRAFDTIGLLTLIIGLLALNLAVSYGRVWGWTSLNVILCLAVFVVTMALFIPNELRHNAPIADLRLFKNKLFTGPVVANFVINTLIGILFVVQTYLQRGRGLTPIQAALLTLGYAIAVVTLIRVGEKISLRTGPRLPMVLGSLCFVVMALLPSLTSITSNTAYFALVFIGLAFLGIGLGLFATPATNAAVSSAPPDKAGVASGIFKMGSSLGGAFGIAIHLVIYGAVAASTNDLALAANNSIRIGIATALLAALVSYFLVPAKKK